MNSSSIQEVAFLDIAGAMENRPVHLVDLPSELLVRIFEFLSVQSLSRLAQVSHWLNAFIYDLNPDLFCLSSGSHHSGKYRLFSPRDRCFTRYLSSAINWRSLCRRYLRLYQACRQRDQMPLTQETFIPFSMPVWYFRPDFQNRWVIVVGPESFIQIKDMDTGEPLFDFPDPNPHTWTIRYHNGWLLLPVVYNDSGQYQIELWKVEQETRGHFKRYEVMFPPEQFKDYHLAWPYMYVLGIRGTVWIYDVQWPAQPPMKYNVKPGMQVYMDSDDKALVHNVSWKEYYFVDKATHEHIGSILLSKLILPVAHVVPKPIEQSTVEQREDVSRPLPMKAPTQSRLQRLNLAVGPLPKEHQGEQNITLSRDRWQQAAFCGKTLVANSIGGRVLVCADWRAAMASPKDAARLITIIEFSLDEPMLHQHISAKDGRVIFEANNQTILLILPESGYVDPNAELNIFAVANASEKRLNKPLTAFEMESDCLMTTYCLRDLDGEAMNAIRILGFAPERNDLA